MQKENITGAPSNVIPIGVILFSALLLYGIWDGTGNQTLGIIFIILYVLIVLLTIRFTMIRCEYLVIGSELVIRMCFAGKKISSEVIPFDCIKAIGSGRKINESMGRGYFVNRYASVKGIFKNVVVIYRKKEKLQKLRFEPSEQMIEYLKMRLSGRYFEH